MSQEKEGKAKCVKCGDAADRSYADMEISSSRVFLNWPSFCFIGAEGFIIWFQKRVMPKLGLCTLEEFAFVKSINR